MLPKKLFSRSTSRPNTDLERSLLSQVIVQSIFITALNSRLHAAIGPKSPHRRETFDGEWIIGPDILGNQDDCFKSLQRYVSSLEFGGDS